MNTFSREFRPYGASLVFSFRFGRGYATLHRLPNIHRPDGTSRPAPWNPVGVTGL
ncbi:MAG: hypothetical protein IKI09_08555 [Bacteroidales bacterium]|nr:hypothetical protein [Bacteroidales bacterium]